MHPALLVVRSFVLYFLRLSHDCFIYGIASESAFITITTNLIGLVLSQKTVLSLHFFHTYVYLSTNVPALGASNMTLQNYEFRHDLHRSATTVLATIRVALGTIAHQALNRREKPDQRGYVRAQHSMHRCFDLQMALFSLV